MTPTAADSGNESHTDRVASRTARGAADLELPSSAADLLRSALPAVAVRTVDAIVGEVPGYAGALTGVMRENIQQAVQLALGGFLSLASRPRGSDPGTPLAPATEGAYALGRGEARAGRSMDALLSAYRVGARESWRQLSATAVAGGLDAATLARFAELVFAYIDELSAASVAGHADQLATSGRVRRRYLQRLGRALVAGEEPDVLVAAAQRAEWEAPSTLTTVLLSGAHARTVRNALGPQGEATLQPEDEPGDLLDADVLEALGEDATVLLVPDADGAARTPLLRALSGHPAVAGPARHWTAVRSSYLRAVRASRLPSVLGQRPRAEVVDTEQHLAVLVLSADPGALADLRTQMLAPLAGLRPASAARLQETLRAWLLHQGRRDDVAAALHVHPQTVRYRMGQVRDCYGDRLRDPEVVQALVVALAVEG